jgi:hypothetical protein
MFEDCLANEALSWAAITTLTITAAESCSSSEEIAKELKPRVLFCRAFFCLL